MATGSARSGQNLILGIFCIITIFFGLVRVRDKYIDRQISKATELERQFQEHMDSINVEQSESSDQFVEISHEGNPGKCDEFFVEKLIFFPAPHLELVFHFIIPSRHLGYRMTKWNYPHNERINRKILKL